MLSPVFGSNVAYTVVVQRVAKTLVLYTDSLIVLISGILIGMLNVSSSSLERGRDITLFALYIGLGSSFVSIIYLPVWHVSKV